MADDLLRQWGTNIARTRSLRTPTGEVRRSARAPEMSQYDLGQLLEPTVSQATVSRWERGLMEPRRIYKTQLATALGVDAAALFPLPQAVA